MDKLILLTDGSVNTKTHVGYGAYLVFSPPIPPKVELLKSAIKVKRFENTTPSRLELQTLLWALGEIQTPGRSITVYTDSQTIPGLPGRRSRLEQNDYRSRKNVRFSQADLYREFYQITNEIDCEFIKIEGHKPSNQKNAIDHLFALADKASRKALREDNQ